MLCDALFWMITAGVGNGLVHVVHIAPMTFPGFAAK